MTAQAHHIEVEQVNYQLLRPQAAMFRQAAPFNLVMGGQGSGKSNLIGVMSGMFVEMVNQSTMLPKLAGIIAANTYMQLSDSTLRETFKTWKDLYGFTEYTAKNPSGDYVVGKVPPAHFADHGYVFKSHTNKIIFSGGAVLFTYSLENYEAIEGVEVGYAFLDETADTREEAVKEVITGRLRQKGLYAIQQKQNFPSEIVFPYCMSGDANCDCTRPIAPLYIHTKPSRDPWLTEMFNLYAHESEIKQRVYDPNDYFYHFDGLRQTVVYSVYHNAHNLPASYIPNRIEIVGAHLAASHIFGDPFAKSGNEYVPTFYGPKHVDPTLKITPNWPKHFTIDFNATPYMSGLLIELHPGNNEVECRVLYEYALAHPQNTGGHLAEALRNDFADAVAFGLFIYGDASGKNRIPVRAVYSLFDDFITNLALQHELRVPKQNPRYEAALGKGTMGRRAFTSALFAGTKGVRVRVHPRCKKFIGDLEACKTDPNGKMEKKTDSSGAEINGHHMQAFEYFACHPLALGQYAKIPGT